MLLYKKETLIKTRKGKDNHMPLEFIRNLFRSKPRQDPSDFHTRIIGVNHSLDSSHLSYAVDILSQLTKGSKVGVEIIPRDLRLYSEHLKAPLRDAKGLSPEELKKHRLLDKGKDGSVNSERSFWLNVVFHALLNEHELIPLESETANRIRFSPKTNERLEKQYSKNDGMLKEKKSKIHYWFHALQTKITLQRIIKKKPEVALIGLSHGQDLATARVPVELPRQNNLRIRLRSYLVPVMKFFLKYANPKAHEKRLKVLEEMREIYETRAKNQ